MRELKITVSGFKYIEGLLSSDYNSIKKALTFRNPKYDQIMKYSKYGKTREPEFITYSKISGKGVEVPRGFDINKCLEDKSVYKVCVKNDTVYDKIPFPEFVLTLRDNQKEALQKFIDSNQYASSLNGSVQLPTGKGKSILGCAIASVLMCKTLIIVHKDDLVKGWKKDIELSFKGKADVGLIKAQSRTVGAHFTIATIQTLNKLSKEELDNLYNTFGFIIQDEMHHCPANSFRIGNYFKARYRLGLTATPERTDGLAFIMNLYYGNFCYVYKKSGEENDILPVEVNKVQIPLFFDPVCDWNRVIGYTLTEDWGDEKHFKASAILNKNQKRISELEYDARPTLPYLTVDNVVTNHPMTVTKVCTDIISEYNKGHSCIAFFKLTETLERYKQFLINKGVPEEDIGMYYGNSVKTCDTTREKAESKRKFITLATFAKATEGTNVNQWEVAFLVSSLNNGKDVEQAIGRIRRTIKSGVKLNTAKVYDYRYNCCYMLEKHGYTRDNRYRKLGFDNTQKNKSRFFKG